MQTMVVYPVLRATHWVPLQRCGWKNQHCAAYQEILRLSVLNLLKEEYYIVPP